MPRRNGFLAGKIIYKYQWRVFQQATLDDHSLSRFISGMVSDRIQILQEWMFLGTGWFWDDSLSSMNIAAETSPWFPLISYSRNIFGGPVYPKKTMAILGKKTFIWRRSPRLDLAAHGPSAPNSPQNIGDPPRVEPQSLRTKTMCFEASYLAPSYLADSYLAIWAMVSPPKK